MNCSCGMKKSQLGGISVSSLQIADGAVFSILSACDPCCDLELFTAECEAGKKWLAPSNMRPWFLHKTRGLAVSR